jgi:4-hydroxybenzoate polyprenyltransferase
MLAPQYALVLAAYVMLQAVYSLGLKRVALLDIFVISAGFVLRAVAGALAIEIEISAWLLLCAFLLALFLALCKRRHEKVNLADLDGRQRRSLDHYDARLLDQLIAIISAATVVCYAIYTLAPDTVSKFGTNRLGLTIPFVIFGVFRYLDLVYRHDKGDRPEKILLTDIPILANLVLYGVAVMIIFLSA